VDKIRIIVKVVRRIYAKRIKGSGTYKLSNCKIKYTNIKKKKKTQLINTINEFYLTVKVILTGLIHMAQ